MTSHQITHYISANTTELPLLPCGKSPTCPPSQGGNLYHVMRKNISLYGNDQYIMGIILVVINVTLNSLSTTSCNDIKITVKIGYKYSLLALSVFKLK